MVDVSGRQVWNTPSAAYVSLSIEYEICWCWNPAFASLATVASSDECHQEYLDCGAVTLKPNDLSNEVVLADLDQLIHGSTSHVVCHHHRP